MASQALKDEIMQTIDKMSDGRTKLVLSYAKRLENEQKSPYGKFNSAEELEEAQKLWEEFESIRKDIAKDIEPIPPEVDLIKEAHEARWRKYESLN